MCRSRCRRGVLQRGPSFAGASDLSAIGQTLPGPPRQTLPELGNERAFPMVQTEPKGVGNAERLKEVSLYGSHTRFWVGEWRWEGGVRSKLRVQKLSRAAMLRGLAHVGTLEAG